MNIIIKFKIGKFVCIFRKNWKKKYKFFAKMLKKRRFGGDHFKSRLNWCFNFIIPEIFMISVLYTTVILHLFWHWAIKFLAVLLIKSEKHEANQMVRHFNWACIHRLIKYSLFIPSLIQYWLCSCIVWAHALSELSYIGCVHASIRFFSHLVHSWNTWCI